MFSDDKKNKMETKYNPINLFLDGCDYEKWIKVHDEKLADISPMPPPENDEEKVKE